MDKYDDGFEKRSISDEADKEQVVDMLELDENDESYHEAYVAFERDLELISPRFATASMILGIIGLLSSLAFLFVFPVLSLILGSVSLKRHAEKRNRAIIGIVTSIITLIIYIVIIIYLNSILA